MKPTYVFRLLILCLSLAFGATIVRAADLDAIKARMVQREGAVDALKASELVGENNRGLLEARGSLSAEQQKTVAAENADRSAVYAAIASRVGTSADAVGRARAAKIAASSRPGVWIQAADGTWAKK